ncbi:MAG: baseplate J/gp47 family protein [Clostridiales bacterium]|nr:baseplate J/gp47 family protein [Clostridiales bacterium]
MSYELQVPDYLTESVDDIHARMIQEAPKGINTVEGDMFWNNTRPIAEELARAKNIALINALKMGITQTATDSYLDLKGEAQGIIRKEGSYAVHKLKITGQSDTIIRAGRSAYVPTIDDVDSVEFIIQDTVTIPDTGIIYATAKCTTIGTTGNVELGKISILDKSDGISSIENVSIVSLGVDSESDADYLNRILDNAANQAGSANKAHYKQWAKECDGVTGCKVISTWDGPNTVKCILSGENNTIVEDSIVTAVKNYIDPYPEDTGSGQAPIGATLTVISCVKNSINIAVKIVLSEGYIISDAINFITIALNSYFSTLDFEKTTYVSYAKIGNIILKSEGVDDYTDLELNGAKENITLQTNEIASMGTLEVSEE